MREIKFRGLEVLTGDWVHGNLVKTGAGMHYIFPQNLIGNPITSYHVDKGTVGQYIGLKDKNGKEIYEGDVTEIEFSDGEIRRFKVSLKTVVREIVSHSSFSEGTAKVAITGVVFEWDGFGLFPCVDQEGQPDNVTMMKIVGNIYDNH